MTKIVADQAAFSKASGTNDSDSAGSVSNIRQITFGDLLREAVLESGDRLAMVDGVADPAQRRRWTYNALLEQAEPVARALLARFQTGAQIALCSPNCPEWVIFEFGTAIAGMVLVPVNPAYREAELAMVLQDSEAAALFHSDSWRGSNIAEIATSVRDTAIPNLVLVSLSTWDEFLVSGEV